jgi:hypothetical protein
MKCIARATLVVYSIALFAVPRVSSSAGKAAGPTGQFPDVEQVISWLPTDTESITVSRGSFAFPRSAAEQNGSQERVISDAELSRYFESLPLAPLEFKDGALARHVEGKQVILALEGARRFRAPANLGEMPYEGCSIAVFSDNLDREIASFIKEFRKNALKVEIIEGQEVSIFQEKLEGDIWTAYVAFPDSHISVVCTDRSYLSQVLARRKHGDVKRALPSDLPEWKYVNASARFWGLRHYDQNQSKVDPSSPFGGQKAANSPDEQAIGFTFAFDPKNGKSATITYLSADTRIGTRPGNTALGMNRAPEAKSLNVRYREIAPGVVEGTYSLKRLGAVQFFLFALEGMLGHADYL